MRRRLHHAARRLTAICQCEDCAGKDDPERATRGHLSDYVWDFVNCVAREVGKTHLEKRVLNCAYGAYTLPPRNLERLEPNVQVCIVGGRRPTADAPEQREELRQLRAEWATKTSHPLLVFENYPFTDRGWYLPSFQARLFGADFATRAIGFNHFQVYFTARMYWGGPEADAEAMLREYCRLFYGPAEREMLAFFDHCEVHWAAMEKDKPLADEALALFDAAKAKAPEGSAYAGRLALIDAYLDGLRRKSVQLGQLRGPVPVLRLVNEASSEIVVDGSLDEAYWQNTPVSATGRLRELQTGRAPVYGTSFQAGWRGGSLYLAIRCDEAPGESLNIGTTRKDDPALWYGDCVEILIETEARSYYQIAVNPAGAVADLDRSASRDSWFSWDAQAEVATRVADDHWIVEIRIPVTRDENDPLHQVIGAKPTQSLPWHINLCRQRVREDGAEHSAFSPTGAADFHHPMTFARFYDGRSRTFEAAELKDDFLAACRAAEELVRGRRHEEALAAFLRLALARAHEQLRGDETAALPAYRTVYEGLASVGAADELTAVQAAAALLVRAGRPDEALAELERIDTEKIGGTWRHSTLLARAEAHAAAGRRDQARTLARAVLDDEAAEKRYREAAAARLEECGRE